MEIFNYDIDNKIGIIIILLIIFTMGIVFIKTYTDLEADFTTAGVVFVIFTLFLYFYGVLDIIYSAIASILFGIIVVCKNKESITSKIRGGKNE